MFILLVLPLIAPDFDTGSFFKPETVIYFHFQVISALRDSGLESSNLILGVDFTKSNEWSGEVPSFQTAKDK